MSPESKLAMRTLIVGVSSLLFLLIVASTASEESPTPPNALLQAQAKQGGGGSLSRAHLTDYEIVDPVQIMWPGQGGAPIPHDTTDMIAVDMQAEEEDDISAILIASIESNSKAVELSPEEAAWVDSCFVSDPLSDDSWDALKNALLKTQEEESPKNTDAHMDANAKKQEREIVEYNLAKETAEPTLAAANGEEHESLSGSVEEIMLRDHIFKVWELERQDEEEEENELIKQLKKALLESKFQGSTQNETVYDKVLDIDELVDGIGDLSLEPPSSE